MPTSQFTKVKAINYLILNMAMEGFAGGKSINFKTERSETKKKSKCIHGIRLCREILVKGRTEVGERNEHGAKVGGSKTRRPQGLPEEGARLKDQRGQGGWGGRKEAGKGL